MLIACRIYVYLAKKEEYLAICVTIIKQKKISTNRLIWNKGKPYEFLNISILYEIYTIF